MSALPRTVDQPSLEALVRHARPGPRYTSYPPATEFGDHFGAAEATAALGRLAGVPDGATSIYCHLPFCHSLCWYCGCNVIATRDRARARPYIDMLLRELELTMALAGRDRPVTEISLGGGSPNFLPPADLTHLIDGLRARLAITGDARLGVELDPRDTTRDQLAVLAGGGFRRMSVGVQDFDPAVQEAIHRIQSIAQTDELIATARGLGFDDVNVDMVYGLPLQSAESFARTVDAVIAIGPDRIALFGYAHLPEKRQHQLLVVRAGQPLDATARGTLLLHGIAAFEAAGYRRIGLDHFARPGSELARAADEGRLHRNFQGYVVRHADYLLGAGVTAISDSGDAYWQNVGDLDIWSRQIERGTLPVARGFQLDDDDHRRRDVINALMCRGEVDLGHAPAFTAELDTLARAPYDELVTIDTERRHVRATPLGLPLIRNVCQVFDRYQRAPASFSPTI
jgi:oxygen-independent coproporphyrinogen III oxidase